jgi:hypothetical protein
MRDTLVLSVLPGVLTFYAASQIKSAPHQRPPGFVSAAFRPSVPKSWDDAHRFQGLRRDAPRCAGTHLPASIFRLRTRKP